MTKYIILGILSGFSMPPFCIFPVIILSYSNIFNLLITKNIPINKKIKNMGVFFMFFNACSMYWIHKPFFVVNMYLIIMPFLLLLLFIYLSIFHFSAGLLFTQISKKYNIKIQFLPIIFAIIFTSLDFVIGTLFGGFPWNFIGYSMAKYLPLIQIAKITTIYGLNFFLYVISAYLGLFLKYKNKEYILISSAIFVINLCYGYLSMSESNEPDTKQQNLLTLIQTNTEQNKKWNNKWAKDQLEKYIELSQKSQIKTHTKLIIWPEAAFPYSIDKFSNLKNTFKNFLKNDQTLIFGTIFFENNNFYNSLVSIDHKGKITNVYHKIKLTPFGEYIPFRGLPFIEKISNDQRDFSHGTERKNFNLSGITFFPLICYEIIFPLKHIDADFILNVSNDAWFHKTIGKDQLFFFSRVRAIEGQKTLIRVSNTGISCIFDKYGRLIYKSPVDKEDTFTF